MLVGSIPLLLIGAATNTLALSTNPTYLVLLFISSAGALAIGNVMWLFLLQSEEATTLSSSSLIIPAVAIFFGWLLLNEELIPISLIGAALILGGIYLVNSAKTNHNAEK